MGEADTTVMPSIQIANEVIASIAGLAAAEVDGVAGMAGGLSGGISEMLGKRGGPSKGVKLEVEGNQVALDLYVVVRYGGKIPEIAGQLQEKVKIQIETMTGLVVSHVNVHVQGVSFASEPSVSES